MFPSPSNATHKPKEVLLMGLSESLSPGNTEGLGAQYHSEAQVRMGIHKMIWKVFLYHTHYTTVIKLHTKFSNLFFNSKYSTLLPLPYSSGRTENKL